MVSASVVAEGRWVSRGRNVDEVGLIYILHFEPAYAHAKHYVGFTERTVAERVGEHGGAQGSPLVRAARAAGSKVILVSARPGTRADERRIKDRKNTRSVCDRCRPDYNDECARRMKRIRQNRRDRARRLREFTGGGR